MALIFPQKDLTEVRIFQKVLGGSYFLLKHPVGGMVSHRIT